MAIAKKARRKYYSARRATSGLSLETLKALFGAIFRRFREEGYLSEALGYECVDMGLVFGTVGSDPGTYFLQHVRKQDLWPILDRIDFYSEEDLFDVIELLYDLVSEPLEGDYHSWNNCGMHWKTFDGPRGQAEFRSQINEALSDYKDGYQLTAHGEIVEKGEKGLDTLLSADLPESAEDKTKRLMLEAISLFRNRHATLSDRRNAVRMLADIFEHLRPKLRSVISSKDESDLFNIANNFEIRHQNDRQKTKYDGSLWLSWMFYFYLATLHLAIRRLATTGPHPSSGSPTP